eukprot:9300856-Pyramimonas_sp.AAC.1
MLQAGRVVDTQVQIRRANVMYIVSLRNRTKLLRVLVIDGPLEIAEAADGFAGVDQLLGAILHPVGLCIYTAQNNVE